MRGVEQTQLVYRKIKKKNDEWELTIQVMSLLAFYSHVRGGGKQKQNVSKKMINYGFKKLHITLKLAIYFSVSNFLMQAHGRNI